MAMIILCRILAHTRPIYPQWLFETAIKPSGDTMGDLCKNSIKVAEIGYIHPSECRRKETSKC